MCVVGTFRAHVVDMGAIVLIFVLAIGLLQVIPVFGVVLLRTKKPASSTVQIMWVLWLLVAIPVVLLGLYTGVHALLNPYNPI